MRVEFTPGCWEYTLLTFSPVMIFLMQLHGCWQKAWYSWSEINYSISHGMDNSMNFMLSLIPFPQSLKGVIWSGPRAYCVCTGFESEKWTLKIGNPDILQFKKIRLNCVPGVVVLFIVWDDKQTGLPLWTETLSLLSKTVLNESSCCILGHE